MNLFLIHSSIAARSEATFLLAYAGRAGPFDSETEALGSIGFGPENIKTGPEYSSQIPYLKE
jgi:hypothetical protein